MLFDSFFDDKFHHYITGLNDELKSIYVYNYYNKNNENVLVVCNSLYEANMFYQSLSNYLDNVLFFPMDDFLTSEALAVSPELKVNRIETLNKLMDGKNIVITNLMGYLRFLPSKKVFQDSIIKLKTGLDYDVNLLVSKLIDIGYVRESVINKTGEVAVRGYVVDIFPINYDFPIRIEFWGDTIDTIKVFNVDTQLTISSIDNIEIVPSSEFLSVNNVPFEEKFQKNLYKYTDVVNISNYMDNCSVFFNRYDDIETGNKLLQEEIFNYNVSIDADNDTKYMFSFDNIKNFKDFFFMNFDNSMNKENYINYNSYDIDSFNSGIDKINTRLSEYLKLKIIFSLFIFILLI